MKSIRCFALFVALCIGTLGSLAQDTWEWRSPTPSGNRLGSFAYGNGLFVGVGENGAILTSPDGVTWTNRESGVEVGLKRVVFDGTHFVAVGGTNILTSANGITWTTQTAPAELLDIAYGNGTFATIAASGSDGSPSRFLTSSSGTSWSVLENTTGVSPVRVLFANGVFIALDNEVHVIHSSDGVSWAPSPAISSGIYMHCAAGNNAFLVSSSYHIFRSTDGIAWSDITAAQEGNPVVRDMGNLGFADGLFFADEGHHGRGLFTSPDGITWTQVQGTPTTSRYGGNVIDLTTLASGGGATVASESVYILPGNINQHAYYAGSSWSTLLPYASKGRNYVIYGLGRYFLAGKCTHDGQTWTDCGFEPTHVAGDRLFRIISYISGSMLSEITSRSGAITTVDVSADGLTATNIDVRMPTPRAVAFGASRYVMVGENGKISESNDAMTWTLADSGTTKNLNAIIFAFNRFIAVGDAGALISSPDGLTWTANAISPGDIQLTGIAAGPDRIVIAGAANGSGSLSTTLTLDGTTTPIAVAAAHQYRSIIYFNGVFLAASYEPKDAIGWWQRYSQLWKSTDGVSWTYIPLHLGSNAYDDYVPMLASGNGTAMLLTRVGIPQATPVFNAIFQTPTVGSTAPAITHPPVSTTVRRGETAMFAVGATGSGPFKYQWYHDGLAIADATKSVLSLNLVTDAAAGDYTVAVTNSGGSVTSKSGHLNVVAPIPLTITEQPIGGTLYESQALSLHVAVSGTGPSTYQWRRDGIPIPSANSATYLVFAYTINNFSSYDVVVTAPYSSVTSEAAIVKQGQSPLSITLDPSAPVSASAGSTLRITATAAGAGPFTYRWYNPGANNTLTGATGPTLVLPYLTPEDTNVYSVEVTDVNGYTAHASLAVGVIASTSPQTSGTATVSAGQDLTLRAGVADPYNDQFQWRFNGVAIPGATGASFTVHSFSSANEGSYDVVVTGPDGTISTRSVLQLTLEGSRLVNLSARAFAGTGEDTLIQGFVLSGEPSGASPNVLVRSVGPTLNMMGVSSTLADPSIRVLDTKQALVAVNDNWSTVLTDGRGAAATSADMTQFGAFALPAESRDSAVLVHETPAGPYTALVSSVTKGTGIVLNEIYGPTSGPQRLVNLSARARVGSGDKILIGGFVVSGTTSLKVLIRGVGPTLASQGIAVPLTNPRITLFNHAGVEIHNNDNWGQASNLADLRTATKAVGAFTLNENSYDAAMLETLQPGVYTVHVASADGTSGVALVEIYEVP